MLQTRLPLRQLHAVQLLAVHHIGRDFVTTRLELLVFGRPTRSLALQLLLLVLQISITLFEMSVLMLETFSTEEDRSAVDHTLIQEVVEVEAQPRLLIGRVAESGHGVVEDVALPF